ncbi:hypothetical protein RR48_15143 [Papilio machaon]|uniref:Uncharacterized protein n=1 Tax=Papilio machaon TaxID=76193 RepID=A0A194QU52_PAPMA|nr:hypothetical protein RR48_15143 [Papilio machaon]
MELKGGERKFAMKLHNLIELGAERELARERARAARYGAGGRPPPHSLPVAPPTTTWASQEHGPHETRKTRSKTYCQATGRRAWYALSVTFTFVVAVAGPPHYDESEGFHWAAYRPSGFGVSTRSLTMSQLIIISPLQAHLFHSMRRLFSNHQ